ncbi:MAG: hypothetical protein IJI45_12900 [Anaerolineaceae bacterium]|nr:hypothetical protein [Anaerolineaceae bacterium]
MQEKSGEKLNIFSFSATSFIAMDRYESVDLFQAPVNSNAVTQKARVGIDGTGRVRYATNNGMEDRGGRKQVEMIPSGGLGLNRDQK